jgi:hypothetical protein
MGRPEIQSTLTAAEKAELARLWTLFETTDAAPVALPLPPSRAIAFRDVSTGPSAPTKLANLALASLSSTERAAVTRLQLAHDSDADPSTVTEADLDAAIAQPARFTPAELRG